MRFITVKEAKTRLPELLRTVKTRQDVLAITEKGVPTAVLLSMEQYEGLVETLEVLSDQQAIRSIRRSIKQAKSGRWVHTV